MSLLILGYEKDCDSALGTPLLFTYSGGSHLPYGVAHMAESQGKAPTNSN